VAEKEASGDYDYLREESDGSDGVDDSEEKDIYQSDAGFGYLLAQARPPAPSDGFDAFDENTWDEALTPAASLPWHRSRQAQTLLLASGVALSAIVVSIVLLAFRGSVTVDNPVPGPTTTPVTTALATASSKPEPPPQPPPESPLPPESPPPPGPPAVQQAPAFQRPTAAPRPTKAPEINVTRYPMSVAPQPHRPH
jgi:hypothetical protein